jgi:hypothetical protein
MIKRDVDRIEGSRTVSRKGTMRVTVPVTDTSGRVEKSLPAAPLAPAGILLDDRRLTSSVVGWLANQPELALTLSPAGLNLQHHAVERRFQRGLKLHLRFASWFVSMTSLQHP